MMDAPTLRRVHRALGTNIGPRCATRAILGYWSSPIHLPLNFAIANQREVPVR